MPAYSMSVGKAKPSDKYSKCETGSGDSDNGCSVEECIKGGVDPKKRSGDYLMITGVFTPRLRRAILLNISAMITTAVLGLARTPW